MVCGANILIERKPFTWTYELAFPADTGIMSAVVAGRLPSLHCKDIEEGISLLQFILDLYVVFKKTSGRQLSHLTLSTLNQPILQRRSTSVIHSSKYYRTVHRDQRRWKHVPYIRREEHMHVKKVLKFSHVEK